MNFCMVIQTFLLKMYFKGKTTHTKIKKKTIWEKDVVMKGDKDLMIVILNKTDYIEKLENMVKEGIDKGTY